MYMTNNFQTFAYYWMYKNMKNINNHTLKLYKILFDGMQLADENVIVNVVDSSKE